MSAAVALPEPATLGIVAGSGELPRRLIDACRASERPFFVLALEGATDPETIADAGNATEEVRIGALGRAVDVLRRHGVNELVMAGRVTRPKLTSLRPDLKGAKFLARIGGQLMAGDNELITHIVGFFEGEGFRVTGAEEVLRDLLAPEGMIGTLYPDKRAQADIETGARIARAIGALDIGQAVVIQSGHVLGVEAVEGTDELIRRCAPLKIEEKGGVLVKVKKPQQERRVDLPSIGVATVERIAECGFAGIAIEAGASLILDRRAVARRADALGVFVIGFSMLDE